MSTANAQIAEIWHHDNTYWNSYARATPRDGYVLFTNPSLPGRYDPNHAGMIRLPAGDHSDIITDIVHFYAAIDLDAVVYLDALSTPSDFGAQLEAHGFIPKHDWGITDLMYHDGTVPARVVDSHVTVISALEDAEYQVWSNISDGDAYSPPEIMYALRYQEVSAPNVTGFIAYFDDQPAGHCLVYASAGIARIESVFVHAHLRRRGVARQLLTTAIHHCQAQHLQTYLFVIHGSPAQDLYASLGFRTMQHDASVVYVKPYTPDA
jgi:GNAT superfamily N-acetyltransferase